MSNHHNFNNSNITPNILTISLIFQYNYTPTSVSHSQYSITPHTLNFNIITISQNTKLQLKPLKPANPQSINTQSFSRNSNLQQFVTFPEKSICTHINLQHYLETKKALEEDFWQFQLCTQCDSDDESLICISCQQTLCSRRVNSHMAAHISQQSNHSAVLYARNGLIYCYQCKCFINLIISPRNSLLSPKLQAVQAQTQTPSVQPQPNNIKTQTKTQTLSRIQKYIDPAMPPNLTSMSKKTQTGQIRMQPTPLVKSRNSTVQTPRRFLEPSLQIKHHIKSSIRKKYIQKRKNYIEKTRITSSTPQAQQSTTTLPSLKQPPLKPVDQKAQQICVQNLMAGIAAEVLSNLTALGLTTQQVSLLLPIILNGISNGTIPLSTINQTFQWLRQQPPEESAYHLVNFLAPYFPYDSDDDEDNSEDEEHQPCAKTIPPWGH